MKRKYLYLLIGLAAILIAIYALSAASGTAAEGIVIDVKSGEFIVDITTTGELEAKNSVEIMGPQGTRSYRIWNMTIQEIVDEGTVVEKGDFVASIDATELSDKIKDAQLDIEKIESQFIQTKLDTTLEMRKSRDELINLEYAVEEKQLILDQSQYEPPATIKQAEIDKQKAERALSQAIENYKIKREQNVAKMQEVSLNRQKANRGLAGMMDLMSTFTITAPEDGMVIYKKEWDGTSTKKGSQISAWNPVVATLPDLTTMISVTYINEVDIRRVKNGQEVEISLDAFPEKQFTGKVLRVANVGEQRPNSDAKVFRVTVEVNEKNDLLRPSMTTGNRIITERLDSVMYVPLESLFNHDDSITYVYKKVGLSAEKQEVLIGEANRNEVIIKAGLEFDDQVYLTKVMGLEDEEILLLPELDGLRNRSEPELKPAAPEPEQGQRRKGGKRKSS